MDEKIKQIVSGILEDLTLELDITKDIEYLIRQISGEKLDEVAVGNEYDTYDGLLRNIFEIRNTFFENFSNRIIYNNAPLNHLGSEIEYDWYERLEKNIDEYDLSNPELRQVVQEQRQVLYRNSDLIVADIPILTFTEDEIQFFGNLLDAVSSVSPAKVMDAFDFVEDITTTSATNLKAREKTYKFWEQVDNQFINLVNELNNSIELIESLKVEGEGGETVYRNIEVPSYIVKMGRIKLKRGIKPNHPVVVDILEAKYIKEEIDDALDREQVTEYRGDQIVGYSAGIGREDKDYISSLDDVRQKLDDVEDDSFISENIILDPLLSIIIQQEEFPVMLNEEEIKQNIEKVISKQRKNIPKENLEFNIDSLEAAEKHMQENLRLYKPIIQNEYKFAIMDGPEISLEQVKFDDVAQPQFTIQVAKFDSGEFKIKDMNFSNYSELVSYINDNTNEFFNLLVDKIYNVESWLKTGDDKKAFKVPQPKRTGGGTRGEFLGRITGEGVATIPYKRVEATEVPKNLSRLSDAIESFYYKVLKTQRVMFKDQPNFVKTERYRALQRKIDSDEVLEVAREIASGRSKPQFTKELFLDINSFVKQLNRANFSKYKSSLKDESTDFITGVTSLFKPLGRRKQKQIQRNLSAKLGTILYGLWLDSQTDKTSKPPRFMYRNLDYWAKLSERIREEGEEEKLSLVNLARFFEDPDIKEYLQSDEIIGEPKITTDKRGEKTINVNTAKDKREINTIIYGDNGITSNLVRAETQLKPLAKAILDSVDLLRKINNQPIHYGQLDVTCYNDNAYTISHVNALYNVDIYATDIDTIVKSENTINELKNTLGLPKHVIYHVKGLYR